MPGTCGDWKHELEHPGPEFGHGAKHRVCRVRPFASPDHGPLKRLGRAVTNWRSLARTACAYNYMDRRTGAKIQRMQKVCIVAYAADAAEGSAARGVRACH